MPLVAVCGADHHKQLDGDLSIAPMELSPHCPDDDNNIAM